MASLRVLGPVREIYLEKGYMDWSGWNSMKKGIYFRMSMDAEMVRG